MPRLVSALPKYRKHKATGQAVVTICGRDIYLGPHGTKTSRTAYDRVVGEWVAAGRPVTPPTGPADVTVAEVMVAYWEHAKRRYVKHGRPTSEQDGIRSAMRPLKELYAKTLATDFGPKSLKAVRQRMIDVGLARTTINQHVSRLCRMFNWAASEELIPATVPQALATVTGLTRGATKARETAPVGPVSDDDVNATLSHLPPTVADMARLQRLTGMRPDEVCSLRPADLDRSGDVWTYRPGSHKTEHRGRARTVFFGPQAQKILASYLSRPGDAYCFVPAESEARRLTDLHQRRKTPLSCGNRPSTNRRPRQGYGERYAGSAYRQAIQRAASRAGVPKWSPNQLRHSAATAIRRGYGVEAAQVTLGHASVNTTQVYAERDAALGVRIAREIG